MLCVFVTIKLLFKTSNTFCLISTYIVGRLIADKADVNRVTFYKHYQDVFDLYDKMEEETLIELGLLALRLEELPTEAFFTQLLDYISDNRVIFGMVFSPNSTGQLRAKLSNMIEGIFRQVESEKTGTSIMDSRLSYLSR